MKKKTGEENTMQKHIPFNKLSKKAQKAVNAERRNDWGVTNPVTKKIESRKAYNRARAKRELAFA